MNLTTARSGMGRVLASIGASALLCAGGTSASAATISVTATGSYEVWGGNELLPDIQVPFGGQMLTVPGYYNTPNSSYALLGQATGAMSYSGNYQYFVVGTLSMASVDAIAIDGNHLRWFHVLSYGNLHAPFVYDANGGLVGSPLDYPHRWYILGEPDGRVDDIGLPANQFALGGPLKGYLTVSAVPELSGFWTLSVGLGLFAVLRRRGVVGVRKKSARAVRD